MVSIRLVFTIIAVLFVLAVTVNAAYRKPPFNGSIFGKRSNTITAEPCLRSAKRSAKHATPGWDDRTPTNDIEHARIQLDTPDANILIVRSLHQRVTASL
ncbi:hypothetical protein E2986_11804 [Frieseomelitta varia]|uniref:Secreted protein n=1 Tax=Frieseomelitta varia TaxID=561572 RepID=A0A833RBH6_9HYME|nr:hypothetical protein E2986_11804 [Frieseomelitta varia]